MTSVFVSDVISKTQREAEIFLPDHEICVRAVIDVDHDQGVKCLKVILSGINSKDGKVYRGIHAARFLKYVALNYTSMPPHEVFDLTRVAQNYIMIYVGTNKLDFNLAVPASDWPEI